MAGAGSIKRSIKRAREKMAKFSFIYELRKKRVCTYFSCSSNLLLVTCNSKAVKYKSVAK